ncbi:histidine kinase [Microbacterium sp.]|uniref:histidine kinase n=1 Tax=Microbacterium sp. TaxID=51671 RepID=UPI003A882F65
MTTKVFSRVAATLIALEALGLLALGGWEVVALVRGDTTSLVSSIALLVLTVVGAIIVAALAAGILRGRSWARSGGVVAQLLLLAVALGAATGQYAHPTTGLLLAVPAVVCLVLLFFAARRAARERGEDEDR